MREIKFRGMAINGEWFYGNPSILKEKHSPSVESGTYISGVSGSPFSYQVRPETLTQFTGIKDKDLRDIYEGDILEIFTRNNSTDSPEPGIYTVVYFSDGFKLEWEEFCEKNWRPLGQIPNGNTKIIGNIFEKEKSK